jgi:cold shock protein
MPSGEVKFYNVERGFGFIAPDDDGPDVFVHATALQPGMDLLRQGQRLAFDLEQDRRSGKVRAGAVLATVLERSYEDVAAAIGLAIEERRARS